MPVDQERLQELLGRAVGDLSAGYGGVMVSIGDKLGLYQAMAGAGPLGPAEVARRAGCAERYVREWLNAQAAGGYVDYHPVSGTYELTPEQRAVFADRDSPTFVPTAWEVPASMFLDEERTIAAFRSGEGVAWGDHHPRMHHGVAGFYRNAYRGSLVDEWIPALDGVARAPARGRTGRRRRLRPRALDGGDGRGLPARDLPRLRRPPRVGGGRPRERPPRPGSPTGSRSRSRTPGPTPRPATTWSASSTACTTWATPRARWPTPPPRWRPGAR